MAIPRFTTTCLSNRLIAQDIYEFRLQKPEGFTFKAGQFVLFDVPLVGNPGDIQTRAFSIASAPCEDDFLFVAKMKEGGRASRWIAEVIQGGTPVTFQGPFGAFILHPENAKDYAMICTSTGIAPFRSQLVESLGTGDRRRMDLLFGVRSQEDLFWVEELQKLSQQYESFSFHIALSGADGNWKGHRGRVQTVTHQAISDLISRQIYVCGNPQMTLEMKKLCLEQWGMDKRDLHIEGYI
jgi:ferredoxin-NADP reductase